MKKIMLASILTATTALPISAMAADYMVDTDGAHASVNFKISHLGYSYIEGRFNNFEGQFSYDANDIEASKVEVTVDTTSLDSNHAERDKHLRSDDFIDASKFTSAKFTSTSVVKKADGGLAITGDMTLHGMTKSIVVDANIIGEGKDPWGGYRAGFEASTRLQVADFGIKAVGASSYVDLNIVLEGIRK